VELLHLPASDGSYMTCMNDWCAFYFSCAIWARSTGSDWHFELVDELQSYLDDSESAEAVERGGQGSLAKSIAGNY